MKSLEILKPNAQDLATSQFATAENLLSYVDASLNQFVESASKKKLVANAMLLSMFNLLAKFASM